MFFSNYSQFLESQSQIAVYHRPNCTDPFINSCNQVANNIMKSQHDLVFYSQFTQIISKRLLSQAYPPTFLFHNPFCPICLRFVRSDCAFITCFINNQRNYLIHQECLYKENAYGLRNVGEIIENKLAIEEIKFAQNRRFDLGFDNRFFLVEITLSHPINDKNYFKLNRKVSLARNHFFFPIDQKQINSVSPNILIIPLTDFHITINIQEVGKKDNRYKFTKYVSLRGVRSRKRIQVRTEGLQLQAEIIEGKEQKQKLTEQMNFKYRYPIDLPVPMLRIFGFQVNLPEEFEQSEEEEFVIDSSSTIAELLTEKESQSESTIRTSGPTNSKHKFSFNDSNSSNESPAAQIQKIELHKLISSDTLVAYIQNNNQSRLFQTFLELCSPIQVAEVIANVGPKLPQLIMQEYGNYMVQKLFTVCSDYQRIQILQMIYCNIGEIVRNKQGTHTLQAFVGFFTLHQEFELIVMYLREDYYNLCKHSNATYFVQKVIKVFPLQYTLQFFQHTVQNLLAFALDKNAMCVIKHMMRRLRELEGKYVEHDQVIDIVRKQLITNVTFSVDQLIMDSFGNYVIQFCYELFDLDKCAGITQRILSKFSHYAVGKFSSNVLLKCISLYWKDNSFTSVLRNLSNSHVIEIFRNKDGNKILLELMERQEGTELWDRFQLVIIMIDGECAQEAEVVKWVPVYLAFLKQGKSMTIGGHDIQQ